MGSSVFSRRVEHLDRCHLSVLGSASGGFKDHTQLPGLFQKSLECSRSNASRTSIFSAGCLRLQRSIGVLALIFRSLARLLRRTFLGSGVGLTSCHDFAHSSHQLFLPTMFHLMQASCYITIPPAPLPFDRHARQSSKAPSKQIRANLDTEKSKP